MVTPTGIAVGPEALQKVHKIPLSKAPASRGILVPGGEGITTTAEVKPLTKDEFNTFMKGKTVENNIRIVVYGTIYYRDIFKDPQETDFCYRFLTGGLWSYCADITE